MVQNHTEAQTVKNNSNWFFLGLFFLFIFLPFLTAKGIHTLFSETTENHIWVPATISVDGLPVIRHGNNAYRCLRGGLLKTHLLSGKNKVFAYPPAQSEVSGFAKIDLHLWIAFSGGEGIVRFNTTTEKFTPGPMLNTLFKRKGTVEGHHLSLIQPVPDGEVWAPSHKHIDYFDPKQNQWKNMDYLYKNFDPRFKPALHNLFPDGEMVWISSRQEIPGDGGLLRFNKIAKTSTLIRRELFDYNAPTTNLFDFSATNGFVFAFYTPKDPLNLQLGLYNKNSKKWTVFSGGSIKKPLLQLEEQLSTVSWSKRFFLPKLKEKLLELRWHDKELPFSIQKQDLDSLFFVIKRIYTNAQTLNIPIHAPQFGLFEHTAIGPATFTRKFTKSGVQVVYKKLAFPSISIDGLIALHRSQLLSIVNNRIALIHLDSLHIQFLSNLAVSESQNLRVSTLPNPDLLELQYFDNEGYIQRINHINWKTKQILNENIFDFKPEYRGTSISSIGSLISDDYSINLERGGLNIIRKTEASQAKFSKP